MHCEFFTNPLILFPTPVRGFLTTFLSSKCLSAFHILFRKCRPDASPVRQYVFASILRNPRRARIILLTASMDESESAGVVVNTPPSSRDNESGSEPELSNGEVGEKRKSSWVEKRTRPIGVSSLP